MQYPEQKIADDSSTEEVVKKVLSYSSFSTTEWSGGKGTISRFIKQGDGSYVVYTSKDGGKTFPMTQFFSEDYVTNVVRFCRGSSKIYIREDVKGEKARIEELVSSKVFTITFQLQWYTHVEEFSQQEDGSYVKRSSKDGGVTFLNTELLYTRSEVMLQLAYEVGRLHKKIEIISP